MDPIQYWISNKFFWIPFYAFLLGLVIYRYKKKAILIVVLMAGLIGAADQTSQFFKYGVERYRPCRTESTHLPIPHIVENHCGGKYGFFSAHSSNSFAIAMFVGCLLLPFYGKARSYLLLWAGIVAYSRIYLGVHYPSDIFVGALFGMLYGWLFYKLFSLLDKNLVESSKG